MLLFVYFDEPRVFTLASQKRFLQKIGIFDTFFKMLNFIEKKIQKKNILMLFSHNNFQKSIKIEFFFEIT